MNGGDSNLGGPQAIPSSSTPATSGSQPAVSDNSASKDSSPILAVPHANRPAPVSSPLATPSRPTPQITPPQPSPQPTASTPTPAEDTFSSLSSPAPATTAPHPIAAPTPYTPLTTAQPAAPVSPAIPSPSAPVAPTMPTDAPITPMQPTSASQPYVYPSTMATPQMPAGAQAIYPTGGNIAQATTPATTSKSRKPLIITIICVGLIAVIALIAWAVSSLSSTTTSTTQAPEKYTTKKEVYDALFNFEEDNYSTLMLYYDDQIGFTPHLTLTEESIIFPITRDWEFLTNSYNETSAIYDDIAPKIPDKLSDANIDLATTKKDINNSLQDIKQNIDLIQKLYDTYILSAFDDSRPATCSKTTDMTSLEQGRNSEVASKYYVLYCDLLNLINTYGGKLEEISLETAKGALSVSATYAVTALNSSLAIVHPATTSIDHSLEELFNE